MVEHEHAHDAAGAVVGVIVFAAVVVAVTVCLGLREGIAPAGGQRKSRENRKGNETHIHTHAWDCIDTNLFRQPQ